LAEKVGFFRKRLTRSQQWALAAFTVGMALVAALSIESPPEAPTSSSRSSTSGSVQPDPTASPRTPLQQKVRAALEREAEAKRADASLPDDVRKAEVGVTTTIVGPGESWPCAPSRAALKELMKLQKAMLDERVPDSVMSNLTDTLIRTRSIMVRPRMRVKILGKESGIRKISVFDDNGVYGSGGYQAAAVQGCWVAAEAMTR
jgi:hypothetical protein